MLGTLIVQKAVVFGVVFTVVLFVLHKVNGVPHGRVLLSTLTPIGNFWKIVETFGLSAADSDSAALHIQTSDGGRSHVAVLPVHLPNSLQHT